MKSRCTALSNSSVSSSKPLWVKRRLRRKVITVKQASAGLKLARRVNSTIRLALLVNFRIRLALLVNFRITKLVRDSMVQRASLKIGHVRRGNFQVKIRAAFRVVHSVIVSKLPLPSVRKACRDEADNRRGIELSRRGVGSVSGASGAEGNIADVARQRQERQENDASLAITAAGGQEQALQGNLRQQAFGRDLSSFGANEQANQASFNRDLSSFGANEGARQAAFGLQEGANQAAFGRDAATFGANQEGARDAAFGLQEGADQQLWTFSRANQQANQQTFGQQSAVAGLQDNFANSGLQREQAQANQGINALNATLSGGSVPQGIGGQIPTTDVGGIINQNYQNKAGQHQQQQNQRNQWLGGLFGLGSAFLA